MAIVNEIALESNKNFRVNFEGGNLSLLFTVKRAPQYPSSELIRPMSRGGVVVPFLISNPAEDFFYRVRIAGAQPAQCFHFIYAVPSTGFDIAPDPCIVICGLC